MTPRVFVSFGNRHRSKSTVIATVTIFSGEIGSHRKVRYAPERALIQGIFKNAPSANKIYDQPLVISHAIPKHSKRRGLAIKFKAFLIISFIFPFKFSPPL